VSAHHSGCYLVRGATPDVLEGSFDAKRRVIVVEFPDRATAVRWYDSPEYREAKSISETALDRRLLLVDGVA
jgi:uncharacterized protein (DUF1330 family)